jgi:hypothetical protein
MTFADGCSRERDENAPRGFNLRSCCGEKEDPLPLWRHAIPFGGYRSIVEQIPMTASIELAPFVRQLTKGMAMPQRVAHTF